jgi:hypothetical protein
MECRTKKEDDGFYHPPNEEEIVCLVKKAYDEGLQVRCRGAAHSVAWSIYTDPGEGDKPIPNKVSQEDPPEGPHINIMLDKFAGLEWEDPENGIVVADAGIHLGKDPHDPTGTSTLENGLLYQAFKKGFGFSDLGGITHQTVSGFLMTGSSGGSLTYDLGENIIGFRIIDGMGDVRWINKDDEIFGAVSLSLGLLGIITKVRLKLIKSYNIYGQEITSPTETEKCPIDMFGSGTPEKPSMREFMEKSPYTRILWWPQKGVNRIVTWQAVRGDSLPVFDPVPYKLFGDSPFFAKLQQLGGAILFTMLGNKGFFTIWGKLYKDFRRFRLFIKGLWQDKVGLLFGWLLSALLTLIIEILSFIPVLILSVFRFLLKALLPLVIKSLQPLTKNGKATLFMDYYWRSLCMDNGADDILIGTEFTEIFIPLKYTQQVMQLLNEHYVKEGYAATNFYSTELYAGYPSKNWMNPGYGEGEYSGGTFRIDIFWYINNTGNPTARDGYFKQFWDLLRNNDIPFRLHWGKFIPDYDFKDWVDYYRSQFPKWDEFLDLRKTRDPKNIFLTKYWKLRLLGEE